MRLIDADAAKERLDDYEAFAESLGDKADVRMFLDDQPTVNLYNLPHTGPTLIEEDER